MAREGEWEGEKHQCAISCLSHTPYWGPGPQLRNVPWLGIEPATLRFVGWHSIHWATPARAEIFHFSWTKNLKMNLLYPLLVPTQRSINFRNVTSASVLFSSGRYPWLNGTHISSSYGNLLLFKCHPTTSILYDDVHHPWGVGGGVHTKAFQKLNVDYQSSPW